MYGPGPAVNEPHNPRWKLFYTTQLTTSYENIFELIQGAYPLHEVTDQEEYEVEDAPIDIIEEQAENVFIEKFGEPIEVFLDDEAENVLIEEFGEHVLSLEEL